MSTPLHHRISPGNRVKNPEFQTPAKEIKEGLQQEIIDVYGINSKVLFSLVLK